MLQKAARLRADADGIEQDAARKEKEKINGKSDDTPVESREETLRR